MRLAFTRKLRVAAIATGLLIVAAGQAAADTYVVLINATETAISVNGAQVDSRAGTWTPLDASVVLADGTIAQMKDMHKKCADGGWLIEATGKTKTSMCIKLGFAEVGCVLASLSVDKTSKAERIDMVKANGTVCSNRWWDISGKEIVRETADRIITLTVGAMAALGSAAGG